MTSHCVNMVQKRKMHLSCLIPFSYTKKTRHLAINIVFPQSVISIRSLPSSPGFSGMRWVNMEVGNTEKYHVSSLIHDFGIDSRKLGCIRCI